MSIAKNKPNVQVVSESLDDGSLSIHMTISKLEPTISNLQARQLEGLDRYLADGNGRGRLNSAATIYQGKVGYFFVSKTNFGGELQDAIQFATDTGDDGSGCASNDTILVTQLPARKKR
ncbi:MAG: hypothetical protein PHV02_00190 [Rhodocyclaceae bacterium]|nr:hypothetical protein [Rhodocyclaceae bacterium]